MAETQKFLFRGVEGLVYAKVEQDDATTYKAGTVTELAPVAEIAKSTETSSEAKYYDNLPLVTVTSEGADTITITCAPPTLKVLAEITGRTYDAEKGCMIEGIHIPTYFAIGYKTKGTDGKYRYVWRYKGQFTIPEETYATENAGTDTNDITLTYTGIATTHKFGAENAADKDKIRVKSMVVDEREGNADLSKFFDTVVQPYTLTATTTTT